jgi:hypothetical protein
MGRPCVCCFAGPTIDFLSSPVMIDNRLGAVTAP